MKWTKYFLSFPNLFCSMNWGIRIDYMWILWLFECGIHLDWLIGNDSFILSIDFVQIYIKIANFFEFLVHFMDGMRYVINSLSWFTELFSIFVLCIEPRLKIDAICGTLQVIVSMTDLVTDDDWFEKIVNCVVAVAAVFIVFLPV